MRKYRDLPLAVKFQLVLGLFLVLLFGALITFSLQQLREISISKGEAEARIAGKEFTQHFNSSMDRVHSTLQTLSETLLASREQQSMSREDIVQLLQHALEQRPELLGFYTLWEPDAYDHNDKAHVKKSAYDDSTGRFMPYVVRNEDKIVIEPQIDYNTPGVGDYYLVPKNTKRPFYMEPYKYKIGGKEELIMSVVVPILDKDGSFLGIVGADIRLDRLQSEASKYKPLGGYVSLISTGGLYVANPNDPDSLAKPFGDNPEKEALWKDVKTGKRLMGYTANSKGEIVARFLDPVQLPGNNKVWYAQTAVPQKTVMEAYYNSRLFYLIIAITAMLVLGFVVAILTRFMVVNKLKLLVGKLQVMAEGDLTQSLDIKGRDEFGMMAQFFNTMTEKLRSMFHSVSVLTQAVGVTSRELTAAAEQTSKASESIAESAQELASGAESQNNYAADTAKAMEEMATGVQRIAESAVTVSSSANDVNEKTVQGNQKISLAAQHMKQMQEAVHQTEDSMVRLTERSEQIGSVIEIISGISKQTHMLALNAAIEASRVGEQGRGFAVVAMEVRKLAEQSRVAAEQVAELIEYTRSDVKNAATALSHGSNVVHESVDAVAESGDIFSSIMKEMAYVNEQIQEVSASAEQMSAGSEQVTASVGQLAHIAGDASGNAANVAAASEEQLASMEQISSSAEALSMMVHELMEKLEQFKVEE
ncbi:methyl-accepting chemotaxis protein [Paenibacillus puldeungensis]|uniref:Methyl-accepting chemotaxis protein n=1 Tax=Paenibacillus puldeungensis TaxID=696536 RepID=A0ABW3RZG6_9BACL